jgi:2-amino-4-hydroxy-6-hydroxymethyldihydropteridine diphosphokinase
MMHKGVYLALGSNIGERERHLLSALALLEERDVHISKSSAIYETEPRDFIDQPWFLNMVVQCETRHFPLQLLAVLLGVERELGRMRSPSAVRRGPRVIDLDILLFGSALIETPQLQVPHPRMLERRFVLEPLIEIAPDVRHPDSKEPLSKYLKLVCGQKVRVKPPPSL